MASRSNPRMVSSDQTGGVTIYEETARVDLDDLNPFPGNAKKHDIPSIMGLLRKVGQYRPGVVVNRGTHTGRPNEILAGHGTVEAARQLGWVKIGVAFVDVSNEDALVINLGDNKTHDNGDGYNEVLMLDQLQQLNGRLDGSGWTVEEVDALYGRIHPVDDGEDELGDDDPVPPFLPDTDDDSRLDRKNVTDCPNCGHTFAPITRTISD